MRDPVRVVAFASGGGTNFQALLDHAAHAVDWRMCGLISNRSGAGALQRADRAGVPTRVIPTRDRPEEEVAAQTLAALDEWGAEVVCLAGYMRLIPEAVVARYRARILNVHPALLPAFGGQGMYGMNVHRAVIDSGARVSGVTVHLVDEEYDQGRIVAQHPVPVLPGDSPEALAARVLGAEHLLYPAAVDHLCAAVRRGEEPGPLAAGGHRFEVSDNT